jgi:single-strand DNA-binding protein
MSINKVILVGNVGKDPVVRYFDKGVAKATFPLATSESYTNQQGESITSTEWHNIVLWRSLAEIAEKTIKKGSQVYVVGKIKTRSYVDKDGVNKYITEILADALLLLEKKQVTGTPSGKTDYQSKGSLSNDIREPSAGYNSQGSVSSTEKAPGVNDPFDNGSGIPDNETFQSNNEDDLPF